MLMDDIMIEFIKSNYSHEWVVNRLNSYTHKNLDDLSTLSEQDIVDIIVQMKPINKRMITTVLNTFKSYAKIVVENDNLFNRLSGINRSEVWEKVISEGNLEKRFISDAEFIEIIDSILYDESLMNNTYYAALLTAIYDGIFEPNMVVIRNLRASDISENTITLRYSDNIEVKREFSDELISMLLELADNDKWLRISKYNTIYESQMEGCYPDTCFRKESRGTINDSNIRTVYYRKIEKINKYLGLKIKPRDLFISGIVNRCIKAYKESGIELSKAIATSCVTNKIIKEEMTKCRLNIEYSNFSQMVLDNLNDFM